MMIPGMEGDEGEPERSERCPPIHRQARWKEKTSMAWEYEGLFNNRITEQDNMANSLLAEDLDLRVGQMGYKTRTWKAGERLEAELFPVFGRAKMSQVRAAKKNQTKEAQERANHARSIRREILLAEANFTSRDYFLHLTYKGAEPSFERAEKDVRNFLGRVKYLRKKRGLEDLKYIAVIEDGEGKKRIHAHMLISGGIHRDELERIWNSSTVSGGGIIKAELLDTENGLEGAIVYMAKELWAKGYRNQPDEDEIDGIARYMVNHVTRKRSWRNSRNLTQVYPTTSASKFSNRKVKLIARDFQAEAREIMERTYPGYRFIRCAVYYSDITDGVYIRAVMRKKNKGGPVC